MDDHDAIVRSALSSVLNLDTNKCEVTVYIASYPGKEEVPIFQRLQLSETLTSEFRNVIATCLEQWNAENDLHQLVLWPHLESTTPEAYEFEHLDLKRHDRIRAQIEGLDVLAIELPVFTAESHIVSGIRFYVIAVRPPSGQPVYFFRTYTPKRELSRSHWFAALLHDGQFDHANTPTFLFDCHLDCFSAGDLLFIVQKTNFRAIFKFLEQIAQEASKTLDIIKQRIPIKNFEQFAEDCQGHIHKLAKLNNIARRPYFATITMDDIRDVIRNVPELDQKIRMETVDGVEMLVYDRADRWAILRLLDNHFMQSLLTKGIYDSNSARLITARKNGEQAADS